MEKKLAELVEKLEKLLENTVPKTYLSTNEAAEYLGIAKSTLYKKVHNNEITAYSASEKSMKRFKVSDLNEYLEQSLKRSRVRIRKENGYA